MCLLEDIHKRSGRLAKLGLIAGLVVCIIGISIVTAFGTEKTPIEIYNPEFEFPTENITLSYWDFRDEFPVLMDTLEKLCKEYEQIHPNITVKFVRIPWDGHRTKYISAFIGGKGPDLCIWNVKSALPGVARSVPDWAVKLMEEKFCVLAKSLSQYNGKYYGPTCSGMDVGQMLYYNKAMVKDAGLSGPPKTLPELVEYGKKLTHYGPDGDIVRGTWAIRYFGSKGALWSKFEVFAWTFFDSTKIDKYNEDFTDVAVDHSGYIEALEFYKNLVWEHKIASVKFPKPNQTFMLRLAAMTNRESFLWGLIQQQHPDLINDLGIAPLMNGKFEVGTNVMSPGAGEQRWVTKDSNHPQVAWDLNMFFRSVKERDLMLAKAEGSLPMWNENWETDYVKNLPYRDTAEVLMSRPVPLDRAPPFVEEPIEIELGTALTEIITDKDSNIEAIWRNAIRRCRKTIAKYWEEKGKEIEFKELRF